MKTFRRLVKIALEHKGLMALSLMFGFFTIGSSVGLLMTSAYVIARAALHPSIAVLQVAIVGVRFFGVARGVSRYVERLISHDVTFRLLAKFRVWFYKAIEPLAPAGLAKYRSGDLLARVVSDVESLEHIYIRVIFPPLVALLITILMWILFGIFSVTYSLVIFSALFVAAVFVPVVTRALSKRDGAAYVRLRSQLNALSIDLSNGLTELLAFGGEKDFLEKYDKVNREFSALQRKMSFIDGLNEALITLVLNISIVLLLFVAVPDVRVNITGIDLAVMVVGIMASFEAVLPIPTTVQHFETSIKAGERIFEITDAEPKVRFEKNGIKEVKSNKIEFQNVTFAYDEKPVLKYFSLVVLEKGKIGIVGASGAGKSTLVNLLARFYDPQKGAVLLGETDIRKLDEEFLRGKISVVSQSAYFFNGSVRENLRLAKTDASDEEIFAATKAANVHDVISALPQGYDTWIGERGFLLSGGERQRLAIARALLKDAPIMIFDEPTANLDAENEKEILDTIYSVTENKTLILITHRLVRLEKLDEIVVMKNGEIAERGNFGVLLTKEGAFKKMYDAQKNRLKN
jgi:ATP-binding cassette subfamily C protein CydC